jgi:predicted nucleic acid-binding protein
MIVVDANIILYAVYETAVTPLAREVYAKDADWIVPELWEAEVLNALVTLVRRGHLDLDGALQAWANAAAVLSGRVRKCEPAAVLRIAASCGLTAYDACYVAVARASGIKVVTEDGRIQESCPDTALSMKQFLGREKPPRMVREKRSAYRTRRARK